MPHVEIKYSDNLDIAPSKLFNKIETIINEHDASAGACKSRAYPCSHYKHTHILINLSLLPKPYRDQSFTSNLSDDIEGAVKQLLNQSAYFSLNIEYSLAHYTTNVHRVEGDELSQV